MRCGERHECGRPLRFANHFFASGSFSGAVLSVASVGVEDEDGAVFARISTGLPEPGRRSNNSKPGSPSSAGIHSRMACHGGSMPNGGFGTNDLTQTALGMSRDDYGAFINEYREKDIIPNDPFQTIDFDGVGALMKIAVAGGKRSRPEIKLGICGEHGGDPASVIFCHEIGLNYVSCSPFRVPIARLAAAQAAVADAKAAAEAKKK